MRNIQLDRNKGLRSGTWLQNVRRPATASTAIGVLIARAQDLAAGGYPLRYSQAQTVAAVQPVLQFISREHLLHNEPAVSPQMCGAVWRLCEELLELVPQAVKLREPIPIYAPRSEEHTEVVRNSALLLEVCRDAVRQVLRGSKQGSLREAFGLSQELVLAEGMQVSGLMRCFMLAANEFPRVVSEAGLLPHHLGRLGPQERVLRAMEDKMRKQAICKDSPYRQRVLHLAIEYFLARFEAAVFLHLNEHPARLVGGHALLPNHPNHRPMVPSLTGRGVTDSGRLVFQ